MCAADRHLFATLQSNLAAAFVRLRRFQEATVAARAAVNAFAQTSKGSSAKAFYRLMQGLEGQRLLPEAVAVGMHAISIIDSATKMTDEEDEAQAQAQAETAIDTEDTTQLLASRKQLVKLLGRIHAQTVGKPNIASDSLLSSAKAMPGATTTTTTTTTTAAAAAAVAATTTTARSGLVE